MHQAEFERHVGAENICGSIADAIARGALLYQTERAGSTNTTDKEQPSLTR